MLHMPGRSWACYPRCGRVERAAERRGATSIPEGAGHFTEGGPEKETARTDERPAVARGPSIAGERWPSEAANTMDCDTTTTTAATHPDSTTPHKWKRRASNLAHAAVALADLTIAEERYARLLANRAGFARPGDARRHKVRHDDDGDGEVFVMLGSGRKRPDGKSTTERHAEELGVSVKTLHNLRVRLKQAGLIEVRQCDRTRRSIVFRLPGNTTGNATGKAVGKSVRAPRTVPRSEPARSREWTVCYRCGNGWPSTRGYRCRSCERDTREPCASPLKNTSRCTRCYTCRPDQTRCTTTRPADGEPCVYGTGHGGQHRVA